MTVDGIKNEYHKGDIYFIPESIKHSGKIYAGCADITFFMNVDFESIGLFLIK